MGTWGPVDVSGRSNRRLGKMWPWCRQNFSNLFILFFSGGFVCSRKNRKQVGKRVGRGVRQMAANLQLAANNMGNLPNMGNMGNLPNMDNSVLAFFKSEY
jgi:hypothetical protein